MKYLHVRAARYGFLVPALQVTEVVAQGMPAAETGALDLTALQGRALTMASASPLQIVLASGPAIAVDAVLGLLDLPDTAFAPAPWLPVETAMLVDALTCNPIDGAHLWRLRAQSDTPP